MADQGLQSEFQTVRLPVYDVAITRTDANSGQFMEQQYINCFPQFFKRPATSYQAPFVAVEKRSGAINASNPVGTAMSPTIRSYGTEDQMVPLAHIVVTQLYDVYVTAFFDGGTSNILIIGYRRDVNTSLLIGTITGANINDTIFLTEFTNGNGQTPAVAISYQLSDKSSSKGYYALAVAGVFPTSSLVQITAAAFPDQQAPARIITGPFQYISGNLHIMCIDGSIWMSQLTAAGNTDVTAWNSTSFVTCTQYPDRGIGIYRYKHLLVAVGQDSIEFWEATNFSPPQSTLVRTDQAFIKFGAFNPKFIINVSDVLYWVAYGSADTMGIWKMEGYVPVKISTQKEDQFLVETLFPTTSGLSSRFSLETILINNKHHLVVNGILSKTMVSQLSTFSGTDQYPISATSDTGGAICCFDIADNIWWGLSFGVPGGGVAYTQTTSILPATAYPSSTNPGQYIQYFFRRGRQGTGQAALKSTQHFYFDSSGLSWFDSNYVTGDTLATMAICTVLQTNTYWFDTEKRKRINKIKVIQDPMIFSAGTPIYIAYNRGNNITADLQLRPAAGDYSGQRAYINNCGLARSLSVAVVNKSITYWRCIGIELDLQQGTN